MKFLAVFVLAAAVAVSEEAVQPYVVPIYRVLMDATTTTAAPVVPAKLPAILEARQSAHGSLKTIEGHTLVHVCSGTLVDDSSIITTVTCIDLATYGTDMNAYVGTAADASSADSATKALYEVSKVIKHTKYDSAANTNNIAVLKLAEDVDYSLSTSVSQITWSLGVPAVEAKCVTSYWNAATPFTQVNKDVVIKACDPVKAGAICSDYTTPPTDCPSGANGASLVCDSKLAGVFTARRNADCSAAIWQYEEISKDATWIWESASAAPILNVSFAAILALVTAMLKSL